MLSSTRHLGRGVCLRQLVVPPGGSLYMHHTGTETKTNSLVSISQHTDAVVQDRRVSLPTSTGPFLVGTRSRGTTILI